MLQDLYRMKMTRKTYCIKQGYMRLCPTESVKDGIVVRGSEFKRYDGLDQYKDCGYQDFEVENLLAVGAVNMLKPCTMANHDVASIADGFDTLNTKLNGDEKAS